MRLSSPRLRRLDDALAALPAESDAMLLSELDGYLAGVIVCPEPIGPDEWLPPVWGDGDGTLFEDAREAQWYAGLVTDHHAAIGRALGKREGRYAPFLEIDDRHGEVMWELWMDGFEAAMKLRPDSWLPIVDSGDERAAEAVTGMITLAQIARDESDLEREDIDALTDAAPEAIARWVPLLHAWRVAHGTAPAPLAQAGPAAKVGRNDPCPCGSGKKYKKCCGAN